jgi:hypothetical protein
VKATADDRVAPPSRAERGPRGRVWLYGVAFALLLVSAWLQVKGNIGASLPLVRSSIWLSAAAILLAVASVLVPGRRLRPAKAGPKPGSDAAAPPARSARPDGEDAGEEGRSPSVT